MNLGSSCISLPEFWDYGCASPCLAVIITDLDKNQQDAKVSSSLRHLKVASPPCPFQFPAVTSLRSQPPPYLCPLLCSRCWCLLCDHYLLCVMLSFRDHQVTRTICLPLSGVASTGARQHFLKMQNLNLSTKTPYMPYQTEDILLNNQISELLINDVT